MIYYYDLVLWYNSNRYFVLEGFLKEHDINHPPLKISFKNSFLLIAIFDILLRHLP